MIPAAVNGTSILAYVVTGVGLITTLLNVLLTVTVTVLVLNQLSALIIIAVKVYVPDAVNVAVLFFAAFVPLTL